MACKTHYYSIHKSTNSKRRERKDNIRTLPICPVGATDNTRWSLVDPTYLLSHNHIKKKETSRGSLVVVGTAPPSIHTGQTAHHRCRVMVPTHIYLHTTTNTHFSLLPFIIQIFQYNTNRLLVGCRIYIMRFRFSAC